MKQKVNIVIPYILGEYDGLELRYALRSIEKNCTDPCNVILIGDKPAWCKNVRHVPVERINGMDLS